MREMVQQVLATEQEANRMVEAAETEAARNLAEARQKAQDLITHACQVARAEAASLVEAAVRTAQLAKQEQLARHASAIQTELRLDENARQLAVAGIVRFISRDF